MPNPEEELTVYRGVSDVFLEKIKREGFSPPPGKDGVYVALAFTEARRFSWGHTKEYGGNAVVVKIRLPPEYALYRTIYPRLGKITGFLVTKPIPASFIVEVVKIPKDVDETFAQGDRYTAEEVTRAEQTRKLLEQIPLETVEEAEARFKELKGSNPGNPDRERDPITGKLESDGFADASIVEYINQINQMGFETCASCSGMRKDHHGRYYRPYLSVVLPEEVAFPDIGGDIFEVGDYQIKDRTYINILMEAGRAANWVPNLQKYLMFLPTVGFYVPETESVAMDETMKKDPELVKVQQEIDEIMARKHETGTFLDAIHRRDEVQKRIAPKYGVRKRSDAEIDQAWKKLVSSLSTASSLLKKMGKLKSSSNPEVAGSNPAGPVVPYWVLPAAFTTVFAVVCFVGWVASELEKGLKQKTT